MNKLVGMHLLPKDLEIKSSCWML